MKFQATRNGQFIGAPQPTREAADAVIAEDKEHTRACFEQGWINTLVHYANADEYVKANNWTVRRVH